MKRLFAVLSTFVLATLAVGCGGGGGGGSDDDVLSIIDWGSDQAGQDPGGFDLPFDTGVDPGTADEGPGFDLPDLDLGGETGLACPGDKGCDEENARECVDDASYNVCKLTGDQCLAWKGPLSCGFGKTCVGGACTCAFEPCGITCCEEGQACFNGYCCTPACGGKVCGDDGCGGECGTCTGGAVCKNGSCSCTPSCTGKVCGGDGCGGSCGGCEEGYSCGDDGQCHVGGCSPKCAGKMCGDDGCGGQCGLCYGCNGQVLAPTECVDGACPQQCCPQCSGKECGDDGCGGVCGICADNETCQGAECVCVPACTGKQCGADGCGGLCGTCYGCGGLPLPDSKCQNGQCPPVCCAACKNPDNSLRECGPDGCGDVCGTCTDCDGLPLPADQCNDGKCPVLCCPACVNRECGDNGCGGTCGPLNGACPGANDQCVNGKCQCVPACDGKDCGPDGCGGYCGTFPLGQCAQSNQTCVDGVCLCAQQCVGKVCGPDGCGGSCGTCPGASDVCTVGKCVCQPNCIGRECGSDGCTASCGTCPSALFECSPLGTCTPTCGNGPCDGIETCETCPGDCGVCSYVPDKVYLVDRSKLTDAEAVMIVTLQGMLAKKKPQIYLTNAGNASTWLVDLLSNHGVSPEQQDTATWYLDHFADQIAGYILYDLGTDSEAVATTLAGHVCSASGELCADSSQPGDYTLGSVAVTTDLEPALVSRGFAKILDVRGKDEAWCRTTYFGGLAHDVAVELAETTGLHHPLRDLAVQRRAFVYSKGDDPFRAQAVAALDDGAWVLGGPTPGTFLAWLGTVLQNKAAPVLAEGAVNLSLLSRIAVPTIVQKNRIQGSPITEDGVHYVALLMGGGHRVDWTMNDFTKQNWWGNANRGKFSVNWEVSPALGTFAPSVLTTLYGKATAGDYFVAAPSGHGAALLSKIPDQATWAAAAYDPIERSDLRVVSVATQTGAMSQADALLELPDVFGVLYRNWDVPEAESGALYWRQGKPALAVRYTLTDDGDSTHTADAVAAALNALPRQPHEDPASYSLVYLDPEAWWGGSASDPACMNTVAQMVAGLQAGVRVVSAEELFYHLRKNFGVPLQTPDDATLSYDDLPTQLAAGETREVHVTMLNTGTHVWKHETGYALGAVDDSDPFAPVRIELPADVTVSPGYEYTFTFTLTAPATGGTYLTDWRMVREGVGFFGDQLFKAVGVGGPPTWAYEAEDAVNGLWHVQGRLDGDGWSFSPVYDTNAARLYGPDETRIPAGSHQAIFRVQSKTGAFAQVATLEVYDADTATVLATKTLYRSSFSFDLTYQDFPLAFTGVAGHRLQFRVAFSDTEFVKVDRVTVK
jgi:hypothetical protein